MKGAPALRRALATLAVVVAILLGAGACRPLYLPPVPEAVPRIQRTRLDDRSSLAQDGDTLRLHVLVTRLASPGWLAVQWFAPSGAEAASDSVWVGADQVGTGLTFYLPPSVSRTPGEWRAVASMDGVVLRQFRVAYRSP